MTAKAVTVNFAPRAGTGKNAFRSRPGRNALRIYERVTYQAYQMPGQSPNKQRAPASTARALSGRGKELKPPAISKQNQYLLSLDKPASCLATLRRLALRRLTSVGLTLSLTLGFLPFSLRFGTQQVLCFFGIEQVFACNTHNIPPTRVLKI